jgi:hypothetical protein
MMARLELRLLGALLGAALLGAPASAFASATARTLLLTRSGNGVLTAPSDGSLPPALLPLGYPAEGAHYSPDGTRVTYLEQFVLKTAGADGSDPQVVLDLGERSGGDTAPRYAPDGRSLFFIYNPTPKGPLSRGIYRVGLDGSGLRRVSQRGRFWGFDISPDGRFLVEYGWVHNVPGTWLQPLGKGRPTRLLSFEPNGVDWASPGQITYVTGGAVHVIAPDGSGDHVLFWRPGLLFDVAWSPDGSQIAFGAGSSFLDDQVFVANADGSNAVQITSTPGFWSWIDWRP